MEIIAKPEPGCTEAFWASPDVQKWAAAYEDDAAPIERAPEAKKGPRKRRLKLRGPNYHGPVAYCRPSASLWGDVHQVFGIDESIESISLDPHESLAYTIGGSYLEKLASARSDVDYLASLSPIELNNFEVALVQDFLEYREKIASRSPVLLVNTLKKIAGLVWAKGRSRYFVEGQGHIRRYVQARLGHYYHRDAVHLILTFDEKKFNRAMAWARVGILERRFMAESNKLLGKNRARRLFYFRVVEMHHNGGSHYGYPHIHIVFPGLKYFMPFEDIIRLWPHGNIKVVRHDDMKSAGYACKYISKLGDDLLAMAYMWKFRIRLYSFSRSFVARIREKTEGWVVHVDQEKAEHRLYVLGRLAGYSLFGVDQFACGGTRE